MSKVARSMPFLSFALRVALIVDVGVFLIRVDRRRIVADFHLMIPAFFPFRLLMLFLSEVKLFM